MTAAPLSAASRGILLAFSVAALSTPLACLANPPAPNTKPRSQSAPPKVNQPPKPGTGTAATTASQPGQNPPAGSPPNPYGRIPKLPSNTGAPDDSLGPLPPTPKSQYGSIPKLPGSSSAADDLPGPLPATPKVSPVIGGSSVSSLKDSLDRVTKVSNPVSGFGTVGAKFSPSEASFGNAMVNLMRDQNRVGNLGNTRTPDGVKWKAAMVAALKPYGVDLAKALNTGQMRTPPTADTAPGTMVDQVVQLVPFLTTKPILALQELGKNAKKINAESDPLKKQQLVTTLQRNAEELVTNLEGADTKLAVCGKAMTDPKVLATLPESNRNLTLAYGQGLLKLREAYQEPDGIIQNALTLGKRILSSPTEAATVAEEFGEESPGPLPPLPTTPTSVLSNSQSGQARLPLPPLPPSSANSLGTLPGKP
ncbi:MAG: hypothetical protein JNK37_17435 [Verrucomicrobiales bacterium]|nr:hypothetical protein [Verrucomicrobiales bacterium]